MNWSFTKNWCRIEAKRNSIQETRDNSLAENKRIGENRGQENRGRGTDDAISWSRPIKIPGGKRSEYKLPASIATAKKRREEAAAKYRTDSDLQGMGAGPAWEGADAPDSEYPDGRTADGAIATLRELKGKPFFLGVGFIKPHLPFVAPKKYLPLRSREADAD